MTKFLLILVICFACTFKNAFGCTCVPQDSPIAELNRADAVFSGKVISISPSENDTEQVMFDVDKTWKGANSATITVFTNGPGGACGNPYVVGQSWLVYALSDDKSNLFSDICSRTIYIEKAQIDLSVLGAGEIAPPAPPTLPAATSSQSNTIWMALICFIGAAAVWALIKLKRA